MTTSFPLTFSARTVTGRGRGKEIGTPTINMELGDVPSSLLHGIYACRVSLDDQLPTLPGAMHFGPRPAFQDTESCEVHLLDMMVEDMPKTVKVEVVKFLRPIKDFETVAALQAQITADIADVRAILV